MIGVASIKKRLRRHMYALRRSCCMYYNRWFNSEVKKQLKDLKSIPVLIINFNQLFYLRKLIDFLVESGIENIIIIDNQSNYKPLLEYYSELEANTVAKVEIMDGNYGHQVLWKNKWLLNKYCRGYYVLTDPDVVPLEGCPDDFLDQFYTILRKDKTLNKVGFGLDLKTIPDHYINKEKVVSWEKKFWENRYNDISFLAHIDTTFALYRPYSEFNRYKFFEGVRLDYPYVAMHGGWYIDNDNMTDEQLNYMKTANASSSWKVDEKGNLMTNLYDE